MSDQVCWDGCGDAKAVCQSLLCSVPNRTEPSGIEGATHSLERREEEGAREKVVGDVVGVLFAERGRLVDVQEQGCRQLATVVGGDGILL